MSMKYKGTEQIFSFGLLFICYRVLLTLFYEKVRKRILSQIFILL